MWAFIWYPPPATHTHFGDYFLICKIADPRERTQKYYTLSRMVSWAVFSIEEIVWKRGNDPLREQKEWTIADSLVFSNTYSLVFLGTYTIFQTSLHLNTVICIHDDRYGKYFFLCVLVAVVPSRCQTNCLYSLLVCLLCPKTSQRKTEEERFIWLTVWGAFAH